MRAPRMGQNKAGMVENPGLSYGLFHAVAQPVYSWGVVRRVEFPGVNIDIGHMRNLAWSRSNDKAQWATYNRMRGQYMSALEHAVPERFFSDLAKCNLAGSANLVAGLPECPQGISAVKALGLAAQQGQKIYTITPQVYANQPNIVNTALVAHSPGTRAKVQAALDEGKEVTIHAAPIAQSGWVGAGFTVIEEGTGAGAYTIEGGSNGGSLGEQVAGRVINFLHLNTVVSSANYLLGNQLITSAISFSSMWVKELVDCYKKEVIDIAAFVVIAIAMAALVAAIGSGGAAAGAAVMLIIAVLAPEKTFAAAKEKECDLSCTKANKFHFASAIPYPIEDIEQFKIDEGYGPPTSPYDVCACEDGSLIIYRVKECWRVNWNSFPHVTGLRWKK